MLVGNVDKCKDITVLSTYVNDYFLFVPNFMLPKLHGGLCRQNMSLFQKPRGIVWFTKEFH